MRTLWRGAARLKIAGATECAKSLILPYFLFLYFIFINFNLKI